MNIQDPSNNKPPLPKDGGTKVIAFNEEYSGLFPHPRLMKGWDEVVSGSAVRIFDRFEKQSDHRMKIEVRVVRANNFKQYTGPVFAFIIAMTALFGGIYTALQGHPFLGGSLSFAGLGTIVGAFLVTTFYTPQRKIGKENKEK